MKSHSIPTIVIVFLLTGLIVSCDKEIPIPNGSPTPIPTPPPPNPSIHTTANYYYSDLSTVTNSARVFYFLSSSSYPITCNGTYCTIRTRYVLNSDSTFWLQYDLDGGNQYSRGLQYDGWYTESNGNVSLTWKGWSVAGPWGAAGTLRGDTLTVAYNSIMSLTDFEDAVYLRKH